MKPTNLVIRCLAERHGRQWVAVSLEFGLAAQADTLADVRRKLDSQIRDYLDDALGGPDSEHAAYLLRRRAPWRCFARYYLVAFWLRIRGGGNGHGGGARMPFDEVMPVTCRG